ncbi:MAG: CAP domain-containing protein [Lachnospiraceae bacterium]|nr:CAP domain-containing protein [Lachnospiraceae bacterium]
MKKKTLFGVIALALIVPIVICSVFYNNKQAGTLPDEAAFIAQTDMDSNGVIYLDEEAIALADTSGDNTSLRSEALKAYNLVNEQREAEGLGTLTWDGNLESAADVRAKEISDVFDHTRPNGSKWNTVNSKIMGGENLAFGYDTADDVLGGWMDSPTHRENILYNTFTKIAISVYQSDDGTLYWAQEFGY